MANQKLTITAQMLVKPENLEFVKQELMKVVPITLKEEGCLEYRLHQDNKNPNLFFFYETWETRELWKRHVNNSHIKDLLTNTEGLIEESVINEMTVIDIQSILAKSRTT